MVTKDQASAKLVAGDVIARLQEAVEVSTDSGLAKRLNVSKATVASWRKRNTIPFQECVRVAVEEMRSLDWLLFGRPQEIGPSIFDLGIDLELLAFVLEEENITLKSIDLSSVEKRRAVQATARFLVDRYRRYLAIMQDGVRSGKTTREEFLRIMRDVRSLPSSARPKARSRHQSGHQ